MIVAHAHAHSPRMRYQAPTHVAKKKAAQSGERTPEHAPPAAMISFSPWATLPWPSWRVRRAQRSLTTHAEVGATEQPGADVQDQKNVHEHDIRAEPVSALGGPTRGRARRQEEDCQRSARFGEIAGLPAMTSPHPASVRCLKRCGGRTSQVNCERAIEGDRLNAVRGEGCGDVLAGCTLSDR